MAVGSPRTVSASGTGTEPPASPAQLPAGLLCPGRRTHHSAKTVPILQRQLQPRRRTEAATRAQPAASRSRRQAEHLSVSASAVTSRQKGRWGSEPQAGITGTTVQLSHQMQRRRWASRGRRVARPVSICSAHRSIGTGPRSCRNQARASPTRSRQSTPQRWCCASSPTPSHALCVRVCVCVCVCVRACVCVCKCVRASVCA